MWRTGWSYLALLVWVVPSHAFRLKPMRDFPGGQRRASIRLQQFNPEERNQLPIVEALEKATKNVKAGFFFPGHKMGRGLPRNLPGDQGLFYGGLNEAGRSKVWQHDLPEIPELDNLFSPQGPILEAQLLAADAFASKKTWFLVNGSTSGVIAAILACVRMHQQRPFFKGGASKIILPRNAHKCAINALILSGAEPIFINPVYEPESDICYGTPIHQGGGGLEEVLNNEDPASIAAVLLVSPTYHGIITDVHAASKVCRTHEVPLIVDEAHGSHMRFMDEFERYESLGCGGDIVVQSTHKTLTGFSQSAMLHIREGIDDSFEENISSALQMVESSSPNYLLLASLDSARWQFHSDAGNGRKLLILAKEQAKRATKAINEETIFRTLQQPGSDMDGAFVALDPLRVTIVTWPYISGFDIDEILIDEYGVYAELPSSRSITFAFGPGNTVADADLLIHAFKSIAARLSTEEVSTAESEAKNFPLFQPGPRLLSPREAHFRTSTLVSSEGGEAIGRISAEALCPYPPGIPILLPGEVITKECLAYLKYIVDSGGSVTGCCDPTLSKLRVIS